MLLKHNSRFNKSIDEKTFSSISAQAQLSFLVVVVIEVNLLE